MSVVTRSAVTGVGGYLPETLVTNHRSREVVDTSDAWIQERTGIKARHRAAEGQMTSDLAMEAARRALEAAGRTPADVDLIVVATTTPDMTFPAHRHRRAAQAGRAGGHRLRYPGRCAPASSTA